MLDSKAVDANYAVPHIWMGCVAPDETKIVLITVRNCSLGPMPCRWQITQASNGEPYTTEPTHDPW